MSPNRNLTHLRQLEAEAIHVFREVAAEFENPVLMFSIGKDSMVMLTLALKAFYPAKPPFPLLHVNTTFEFKEMRIFRDKLVSDLGLELIEWINQKGVAEGINPFEHGAAYTNIMKTDALKQALSHHKFDAAFGGARRDEERARAKERVYSFRDRNHQWDPKNQRPELWRLYNGRHAKGESIRVFPLSNWTELDVWQYIHLEKVPIVPLYFAAKRPIINYNGTIVMVDDDRMPIPEGQVPTEKMVRFRTLGDYALTGGMESTADTVPKIIHEMLVTNTSERYGRVIDKFEDGAMEKKKRDGYF